MSNGWRSSPDTGPRAKCDQVVFEAMAKAAEIIVHSRCPLPTPVKPSSSRFNLHVPEIDSVRNSLQRWRRSLHVPLRLDVYYQHSDSRELLERWCLEFTPTASGTFECTNPDPIVQLRHVCKKVVVWLRTLYSMARLLPAHVLLGQKLCFEIDVLEDTSGVQQEFRHETLPPVPTPYGPLQWNVWFAPSVSRFVQRRKTQPIPMMTTNHIAIPSPPAAQSAPTYHNHHYPHVVAKSCNPKTPPMRSKTVLVETTTHHHPSILQRSNSLEHSTERRSALSLALLAEESSEKRRAALHNPPPVEASYGYAYNNNVPPSSQGGVLSTSPAAMPPLSSTPPFVGEQQPHNAPLLPPRSHTAAAAAAAPPFATLPTSLSEPDIAELQDPPPSSLDLLHSSPFKQASSIMASFSSESEVLKHSVVIPPAQEEDMPFALGDEQELQDSAVTCLAHKCATASRLQLFEESPAEPQGDDMVSSLADQLAEFKSFGASLHVSSSNSHSSKNSASSSLISMRT